MASHRINGQVWPPGTLVSVYKGESQPAGQDTTPAGSAVTSATVSGSAVTFSGLEEGRRYIAYAAGVGRRFLVQPGSVDTLRPISGSEAQAIRDSVAVVQEAPLNLMAPIDSDAAALGDGTGNDGARINARLAAFSECEILLPPRQAFRTTEQIVLGTKQRLIGGGGFDNSNSADTTDAPSSILAAYDGDVILCNGGARSQGLANLMVIGDTALANQVLLAIGDNATNSGRVAVENVTLKNAGKDALQLRGLVLNCEFDHLYLHGSKRYNLYSTGTSNNANKWTKLMCREAGQWGIYWGGGKDNHFDNPTIESNGTLGAYGGLRVASDTWGCQIKLTSPHFENNDGTGAGVPVQIDVIGAHGGGPTMYVEDGAVYSEDNSCVVNDGFLASTGLVTNLAIHAVIGAGHDGALFLNPVRFGGTFAITDNSGKAFVIHGNGLASGAAADLYAVSAGLLRASAQLDVLRTTVGSNAFSSRVTGDTNARMFATANGRRWRGGAGSSAATLTEDFGTGSPEGVVTATVGSTYQRTDGGAGTSFYVKESGAGNTGWVAK